MVHCPGTYLIMLPIQARTIANGTNKEFNQFHLNAMYNLLNKVYTDIIIQPGMIENEHTVLCEMVDRYSSSEKTIFIVDRGYESYKLPRPWSLTVQYLLYSYANRQKDT